MKDGFEISRVSLRLTNRFQIELCGADPFGTRSGDKSQLGRPRISAIVPELGSAGSAPAMVLPMPPAPTDIERVRSPIGTDYHTQSDPEVIKEE